MRASLTLAVLLAGMGLAGAAEDEGFKAGVAIRVITPSEPMWLAGYSNRTKPAEGKVHDLHVKALALEDPLGERLVLVTSDLIGFSRTFTGAVADEVRKRVGLERPRLVITCSHTHCGPVLQDNLIDMYDMPAEEQTKIGPYSKRLRGLMVEAIVAAVADLKPARLAVGQSTARFAVNRRKPTPQGVTNDANPDGPVDHDVPVLRVMTLEGKLRAVVFGYACHNTTMQFYQWCGDYAGFAQVYLEEKHPGAVALFWAGCGGDQNPLPRSKLELCQKYGRELADAVEGVLRADLRPVRGACAVSYDGSIRVPLDKLPNKEQLAADLLSKTPAVRKRATRLLKVLDEGGTLADHYPHYPVQVWRLGDQVVWVALGGEVVVDYSLRLKKELAGKRAVWVTAYANDVMAYIPSLRVLREGGYEGESSMVYYGMPTKWGTGIEEKIVGRVHELVKDVVH